MSLGNFDPYVALGVERNATIEEIEKAAKAGAKKAHPDAGGTVDEFLANRRALQILSDPDKRKRYDETGDADENNVNNVMATALQIVTKTIASLADAYVMNGFDPKYDPRKMPLVEAMKSAIEEEIDKAEDVLDIGKKTVVFLKDFASRFSRPKKLARHDMDFDFLKRTFADRVKQVETQIPIVERSIAAHKLALDIIGTYEFRDDGPVPFQGMGVATWR